MTPVAVDTETELIQPGARIPRLVCVSYAASESEAGLLRYDEAEAFVEGLLTDLSVRIVGHYIAYDMAVIGRQWPHLLPAVFRAYADDRIADTGIRAKLADITLGRLGKDYSLSRLVGGLDKDTWRLRYAELRDVPVAAWPEAARAYAIDDARAALSLYLSQEGSPDEYRQARADWWLSLMSAWGLVTDGPAVERLAASIASERDGHAAILRREGLLRGDRVVNGIAVPGSRNTRAAQERAVAAYEGRALPLSDGGKPALDKISCKDSGDPVLESYAALSSLGKQLSTDIPALRAGISVPIHSRFDLAETGRTRSSKPNVQNQKTKGGFRECFIPRPGHVYVGADYSVAELCSLAQICLWFFGHSSLAEAINGGLDPHLLFASRLSGRTYDRLVAANEAGDPQVYQWRQTGKIANFGFPGGLGPASLVAFAMQNYSVRITFDGAKDLKRTWFVTWPEMRDYFAYVGHETDCPFPSLTHPVSDRVQGGMGFTDACNTLFQGLTADMGKDAGFLIAEACYVNFKSPLWGCRPVNFVHDEFILEAPERRAHEAGQELSRLMLAAAEAWLPDIKVKAKPWASRRWSKSTKTIYSEGRLQIDEG